MVGAIGCLRALYRRVPVDVAAASLPADMVDGGVARDREDPAPRRRAPGETGRSLSDPHERILDEIVEVGSVTRARKARKEPVDGLVMAIEDLAERGAVAASAGVHQLLVGTLGPAKFHVLGSDTRSCGAA